MIVTERISDTLTSRGLPKPTTELTAGRLARIVVTMALDPQLLLSHLDGFDSSFDDERGVFADSPGNGDHLR